MSKEEIFLRYFHHSNPPKIKESVLKCMEEFADQQSKEVRDKAIQQCQDKIDDTSAEMCENISDFRELINEELEKLKG